MNEETKAMLRDIAESLTKKFRDSLEEEFINAVLPGTEIIHEDSVFVVRYNRGGLGCDGCHFSVSGEECPRNEYGKTKCGDMGGVYLEKKA